MITTSGKLEYILNEINIYFYVSVLTVSLISTVSANCCFFISRHSINQKLIG